MAADRSERLYPPRPMVGVGAVVWDERTRVVGAPRPAARAGQLGDPRRAGGARRDDRGGGMHHEVLEECGIEIEVGPILGLFQPIDRDADSRIRYHFTIIDFLARYRSGALRAGDDAADVRWVPPADLPHYRASIPRRTEMIERALERLKVEG